MIEAQVVRNALSLVHRNACSAKDGPFIDSHGRVHTERAAPSCPYTNIVRSAFLYNVCCRLVPDFARRYGDLYDEFIAKSSPYNMMAMRVHDVGLGVQQLRALQKDAVARVRSHPAMRAHGDMADVVSSPCTITVETGERSKSELGSGQSAFVVTARRLDAARDWPTIPPASKTPAPDPVTRRVSPAWLAKLAMLRELVGFELGIWEMARDAEARALLAGWDADARPVHLIHMAMDVGAKTWDAMHPDIRRRMVDSLRTLVETLV